MYENQEMGKCRLQSQYSEFRVQKRTVGEEKAESRLETVWKVSNAGERPDSAGWATENRSGV